jgi:protein-tyrosine-phosphatase/predicted ATP-grasp superfamily ATP-dependent carboligase
VAGEALILGAEPRVAVTIARSLHRRGVRTTVGVLSEAEPGIPSRVVGACARLPDSTEADGGSFLSALLALLAGGRFDLLIPSSDRALAAVAAHDERLRARVRVGCPPARVLQRVLEKSATLEIAARCGVPVPPTYDLDGLDEGAVDRADLEFPVVAKPRDKSAVVPSSFKVRYLRTRDELRLALRLDPGFSRRNVLQGYCVGEGVGVAVLLHEGEPLAAFQHRRLREFPHTGGVGVLTVSEPPDPRLVGYAVTLLRALEWEGVAMVEFRRNPADGRAVLMEVNGRYWGSLSTAIRAGMDFPAYEWQLAHGEHPEVPSTYRAGIKVRWLAGDLLRLHGLLLEPAGEGAARPSRLREAAAFAGSFGPTVRSAYWWMRDPVPPAAELGRAFRRVLSEDLRALAKRMIPGTLAEAVRVARMLGGAAGAAYLRRWGARAVGLRRDRGRAMPPRVTSVLFVCHGNIIRSPMAAAMLARALGRSGEAIAVRSAGLHTKPGAGADERARAAAREFAVSLDDHVTQPVTAALVRESDVIFVMDFLNEARLVARHPEARRKVFMLGGYGGDRRRGTEEIADPYQGTAEDVRECCRVLQQSVDAVAEALGGRRAPGGRAWTRT